ncbi:methyltransferase domain-containing protein [Halorubrum sp. RMP-47]|uniref:Methyltransferase domain-containing protein n=1 Tax=Halorubrum miltondacostae TaxID=3076378 RepID=A0ABD5M0G3_9EURY
MADDAARRGQRVYDRWAEYGVLYRAVDRLTRSVRKTAGVALGVGAGDAVLDLGCGPGGSLPILADAVGADGTVIGVDYSAGMVRAATERARANPPAAVIRGDAGGLPLRDDAVDAAFASLALSAMPAIGGVLDEVERVVRPGGRLVVVDGRAPDGAAGSALRAVYRRLVNFRNPDVLAVLRHRFGSVTVVESFDAGLEFVARADVA